MNCPLFEGKVYMITSKETEKIYIGSTTQILKARLSIHKNDIKLGYSCSAKEILKYPDAYIYLLDRLYVTQSKSDPELLKLEGRFQLIHKDICVNKNVSRGLTRKEHNRRQLTDPMLREKLSKLQKRWNKNNKEYIKKRNHFSQTSFFGQLCKMYKIYIN